jgi:hypothetical protein
MSRLRFATTTTVSSTLAQAELAVRAERLRVMETEEHRGWAEPEVTAA